MPPVRLTVRAKPSAKESAIARADGLEADVRLAAPPIDGKANDELVRILSKALGVPRKNIAVVMGQSSKQKVVQVEDVAREAVEARLQAAVGRSL
ncbi:MAG: DUF167 domain-containing protein [Polyangiaceae bacterium]